MTQMSNIFRELKVLTLEKLRDASGGAQFFREVPSILPKQQEQRLRIRSAALKLAVEYSDFKC